MTLEQVSDLPAHQFAGWVSHLTRYPVGSRHTHYLLASILVEIRNLTLVENQTPAGVVDVAPWLSEHRPAQPVDPKKAELEKILRASAVANKEMLIDG